jgi:hypothetical protein
LLLPNKSPQQYAQTLYNKLKEVLDSVNSSWKPSLERKAAMTAVDEPVEPKVTFQEEHEVTPKPEAPEFSSKQILRNPEQVHKVLLVVHKLSLLDFIKNQVQFMDAFRAEMGWQDFSKHATGSVIASLARRGYVARILSGKTIIGYALNEKGKQLIPDFVETQKSIPSINTAKIIRSLGNTGEWLLNSAKRLAVIEEEEELCKLQLSALEEEKRNICSKVNPETQLLLQQLSQTLKD